MRGKYLKVIFKFFLLFVAIFHIGGCMEDKKKTLESYKNQRFPVNEYFEGKRLEMGKAIYKNDIKKVEQLLNQGININELSENKIGFTYLMYAVFLDQRFEIAELLLKNGANPNLVSKVLSKDKKRYNYYLPLTFVAEDQSIEYIKLLLRYGADPNYAYRDEKGKMPLTAMYAINAAARSSYFLKEWERKDFINDVKARINLLVKYGADINSVGNMNKCVVEFAANTKPEIALYLMDKGADHRLYGEKVTRLYRRILKNGVNLNAEEKEILDRLTKLGY